LRDFEASFAAIASMPCDILLTPHPDVSNLWQRIASRDKGAADALIDPTACSRLVDSARTGLKTRLDREANPR
jgi:metallo-beta-lactamase class B